MSNNSKQENRVRYTQPTDKKKYKIIYVKIVKFLSLIKNRKIKIYILYKTYVLY